MVFTGKQQSKTNHQDRYENNIISVIGCDFLLLCKNDIQE